MSENGVHKRYGFHSKLRVTWKTPRQLNRLRTQSTSRKRDTNSLCFYLSRLIYLAQWLVWVWHSTAWNSQTALLLLACFVMHSPRLSLCLSSSFHSFLSSYLLYFVFFFFAYFILSLFLWSYLFRPFFAYSLSCSFYSRTTWPSSSDTLTDLEFVSNGMWILGVTVVETTPVAFCCIQLQLNISMRSPNSASCS